IVNAILKLMTSSTSTEQVKVMSAESLGVISLPNDKTIAGELIKLLQDDSPVIRKAAVTALGNIITVQNSEVSNLLTKMLYTDVDMVKEEVINVLAKVCDVETLVEQFKQKKEMRPQLFSVILKAI